MGSLAALRWCIGVVALISLIYTGGTSAQKTGSATTKAEISTTESSLGTTIAKSDAEILTETTLSTTETSVTEIPVTRTTLPSTTTLSDIADFPAEPTVQVPDDTYLVQDGKKICILIKLDAKFAIDYKKKKPASKTKNLALPDDLLVSGSCGTDKKSPEVSLGWQSYRLYFTFDKNDAKKRWFVKSVQLSYSPAEVFKDSKLEKLFRAKSKEGETFMQTPLNMSYSCADPQTITMYDEIGAPTAYAVIESLKLQAYVPDDGNFGTEFACGSKIVEEIQVPTEPPGVVYRSDSVPIAVGSTLAVITVVVVGAYGIYRSLTVKKLDYDTMEE